MNKIEKAEEAYKKAKARFEDLNQQAMDLHQKGQSIQDQLRGDLPALKRLDLRLQLSQLDQKDTRLAVEIERAGLEMGKIQIEYRAMQRRLEIARHNLDAIRNPPAWGVGDQTRAEIRRIERLAEETIHDLTKNTRG